MKRILIGVAAIALAAGLGACGGGGGEFEAKMKEACEKDGGKLPGGAAADCACAAKVMDAELDADTKKFMVAMMAVQDDPAKAEAALKDAGLDPAKPEEYTKKMQDMGTKMEAVIKKVEEQCKK